MEEYVTKKECELISGNLRREMQDGFRRLEERIDSLEKRMDDKFDEVMFNNNDKEAKRIVSDHRPVWAKFNTSLKDYD